MANAKKQHGGRLMLTVSTPTNCQNTIPPAIKYWKKGFRFIDDVENETMRKVLRGELPMSETPEHLPMFYDFAK